MFATVVILAGLVYFSIAFTAGFIPTFWLRRLALFAIALAPAIAVLLLLGLHSGCAFRVGGEECGAYGEAMAMAVLGLPVWLAVIAVALWLQRIVADRLQRSNP